VELETLQEIPERDETLSGLLIEIGMKRNVSEILAFLGRVPEAVSQDIECTTGLHQSEVSLAMKYLSEQGWIKSRDIPHRKNGRGSRAYSLALPLPDILDEIGNRKKSETLRRLELLNKLRSFT
jgi:predicted transcriptional regulator